MRLFGASKAIGAPLWLALLIFTGCSSDGGDGGSGQATTDTGADENTPVHVAFAGGGWRAHTAHAGWLMSLLDDGAYTVNDVLGNVETLSSNSGGTWFLSMLTYSADFRASLEGQDAFANFISPQGYLGQERALFDDFETTLVQSNWCPFQQSEPLLYFYCRLASLAGSGALVWTDIVNNIVFEPFGMNRALQASPTLLSSTRQNWAEDKSLLIAATMLTDRAILTETYTLDKLYYDAVLSGSGPQQVNVTPVTFASVTSERTPPPVLSAGTFDLTYQDADWGDSAEAEVMNSELSTDNVPVLLATAASSAAVGALASYSVLEANGYDDFTWQLAYELSDLAVPVTLRSPITAGESLPLTVHELAASRFARFADGGYQDNSAVAQLVSFLQSNDAAEDFQVVAFDNVQGLYTPPSGTVPAGAEMGIDIALLFGEGGQTKVCAGTGNDEFCVAVPAQQVFALADPDTTTPATWSWTAAGANGPTLSYTQYDVITTDNATLGVVAGTRGTLHAFTCIWPTADTAPWNGASDFDAYEAMLNAIRSGLQANNNEGLDLLREALNGTGSL
jgi:hypothetical protein